jgi:hypothetical protein
MSRSMLPSTTRCLIGIIKLVVRSGRKIAAKINLHNAPRRSTQTRGVESTVLHEMSFPHAHIELQLAHQERRCSGLGSERSESGNGNQGPANLKSASKPRWCIGPPAEGLAGRTRSFILAVVT